MLSPLALGVRLSLALVGATALGMALAGCGSDSDDGGRTITRYGAAVPSGPLGQGTFRAYVTRRGDVPISLGVEMTEGALNDFFHPTPPLLAAEVNMPVPPGLEITPFVDVSMFLAEPHPPAGNQITPHIHPTWYVISNQERLAIPPQPYPVGSDFVPPEEMPPGNIVFPGGYIATVGHLIIDPDSQGYAERPFMTTEYEYRFYFGKMTLIALGIANPFLASKQSRMDTIPVPQKYRKPGYYPTRYHVEWVPERRVWNMAIDGFVLRD